jgi:hypothetical protein
VPAPKSLLPKLSQATKRGCRVLCAEALISTTCPDKYCYVECAFYESARRHFFSSYRLLFEPALQIHIHANYPLEQATTAHADLEERHTKVCHTVTLSHNDHTEWFKGVSHGDNLSQ